jgi:hypothetical protein
MILEAKHWNIMLSSRRPQMPCQKCCSGSVRWDTEALSFRGSWKLNSAKQLEAPQRNLDKWGRLQYRIRDCREPCWKTRNLRKFRQWDLKKSTEIHQRSYMSLMWITSLMISGRRSWTFEVTAIAKLVESAIFIQIWLGEAFVTIDCGKEGTTPTVGLTWGNSCLTSTS